MGSAIDYVALLGKKRPGLQDRDDFSVNSTAGTLIYNAPEVVLSPLGVECHSDAKVNCLHGRSKLLDIVSYEPSVFVFWGGAEERQRGKERGGGIGISCSVRSASTYQFYLGRCI